MALNLPQFNHFDTHTSPMSLGYKWKAWLDDFKNLLLALGVEDGIRQKALLLFYAGKEVHEIYKTLITAAEADIEFEAAAGKLTSYFEPKVNKTFEIYHFRKLFQNEPGVNKGGENETVDEFVTRLKKATARCGFTDVDLEIKLQLTFGCVSKRVRRKALGEDISLDELIKYARAIESSGKQADIIEEKKSRETVNRLNRPGRYSKLHQTKDKENDRKSNDKHKLCFSCGGEFPHIGGREACPAFGKKCSRCQKFNHFAKMCRSTSTNKELRMVNKIIDNNESADSESDESSVDEYVFMNKEEGARSNANVKLKIGGCWMKFQIDTGASVNVLDEDDLSKISDEIVVKKTNKKIFPYGSQVPLPLAGKFETMVESKRKMGVLTFYIAKHTSNCMGSLLGLKSASDLGLISIVNRIGENTRVDDDKTRVVKESVVKDRSRDTDNEVEDIIQKYTPSVFSDKIGKMKGVSVTLSIDESVKPKAIRHRRIPFHLRNKVEKELERLLEADVIEEVNEPTGWVSPVVIANKPDGNIRLCVDMTEPNKSIRRVHHVIPTIDDIRYQVNGAKFFSKIDLNKGYHQLELAAESRNITTFSTHKGLGRFKRLNLGCKSATEIFHESIRKILQGVKGVLNIHDDICVFGATPAEHHQALKKLLEILQRYGLTANTSKCEIFKTSIKFYGLIFSREGIRPDPSKVRALNDAKPPTSKKELKSFLGMANYSSNFIQNYSDRTVKLRELITASSRWRWTNEHEKEFVELKSSLAECCLLQYFNPNSKTEVICDASPFGLGAVLVQISNNGPNVVAYASRSLTKTEQNYSQIEREALSILFGCLKFQVYLLGSPFTVVTDHLPLVPCFNRPKTQMPFRIERIRMKLQGFEFSVRHCRGESNISDYISRHFDKSNKTATKEAKEIESHIHAVMSTTDDCISIDELKKETSTDPILSHLKDILIGGMNQRMMNNLSYNFQGFKHIYKELYVVDELIMRRNKIIVPASLCKRVIHTGHDGHQGIVKTKALLRSKF